MADKKSNDPAYTAPPTYGAPPPPVPAYNEPPAVGVPPVSAPAYTSPPTVGHGQLMPNPNMEPQANLTNVPAQNPNSQHPYYAPANVYVPPVSGSGQHSGKTHHNKKPNTKHPLAPGGSSIGHTSSSGSQGSAGTEHNPTKPPVAGNSGNTPRSVFPVAPGANVGPVNPMNPTKPTETQPLKPGEPGYKLPAPPDNTALFTAVATDTTLTKDGKVIPPAYRTNPNWNSKDNMSLASATNGLPITGTGQTVNASQILETRPTADNNGYIMRMADGTYLRYENNQITTAGSWGPSGQGLAGYGGSSTDSSSSPNVSVPVSAPPATSTNTSDNTLAANPSTPASPVSSTDSSGNKLPLPMNTLEQLMPANNGQTINTDFAAKNINDTYHQTTSPAEIAAQNKAQAEQYARTGVTTYYPGGDPYVNGGYAPGQYTGGDTPPYKTNPDGTLYVGPASAGTPLASASVPSSVTASHVPGTAWSAAGMQPGDRGTGGRASSPPTQSMAYGPFGGASSGVALPNDQSSQSYTPPPPIIEEPGGGACFPAGTMVLTPRGQVDISLLKTGDSVLSWSMNLKQMVSAKITEFFTHEDRETILLKTTSGSVVTTSVHRFYTGHTWVHAANLIPNKSNVQDKDGKLHKVLSITPAAKADVYNFHVNHPDHNYFANNLLVHNRKVE